MCFQFERNFVTLIQIGIDVSDGRCGIIVSIPDHCLPFYIAYVYIKISGWQELEPSLIKDQICQEII